MNKSKFKNITPERGVIKFNNKFLNTLTEKSNSGVQLYKTQHHLSLHPIHLHDVNKSVKDRLNQELAKYNKKLGGIILGYQSIKLLSDRGLIVNDSCYIHIDLLVEFFVLKPEVGKKMRGFVNKKSKSHIGVLVYDIFNVSIPKPEDDENWLGTSVNLGQEVLFRISDINMLSHLPYIGGKLISVMSNITENNIVHELTKMKSKPLFLNMTSSQNPKKKLKKQNLEASSVLKSTKRKHMDGIEEMYVSELPAKKKSKKLKVFQNDDAIPSKKSKLKEKYKVEELDQVSLIQEITSELSPNTSFIEVKKKRKQAKHEDSLPDDKVEVTKKKSKKSKSKIDKELENYEIRQDTQVKEKRAKESEELSMGSLNLSKLHIGEQESESHIDNLKRKKVKNASSLVDECDISVKKHKRKSD